MPSSDDRKKNHDRDLQAQFIFERDRDIFDVTRLRSKKKVGRKPDFVKKSK